MKELNALVERLKQSANLAEELLMVRECLHEISPFREMPVDEVRWVPIEMVCPNDYNPNSVANKEMGLLYRSIMHDGYTQPIVTIWDSEKGKYVIIDGFHRYHTALSNSEVLDRMHGHVPIVVLKKTIAERMAATVRHNRARGSHSVQGMSNMVYSMLKEGLSDADICNELGMEPEELIRLKHITGYSKLYASREYSRAYETKEQIKLRIEHERAK